MAATRIEIIGLDSLKRKFSLLIKKKSAAVVVGYTAFYSVWVHENLNISHPMHDGRDCGGQAKFLEQPVNLLRRRFGRTVRGMLLRGKGLLQALLLIGYELQRSAQLLTPVDTGHLKDSAFTRPD